MLDVALTFPIKSHRHSFETLHVTLNTIKFTLHCVLDKIENRKNETIVKV